MKINKIQWYIKILNVTVLQENFKYCKIYVLCISLKYAFFNYNRFNIIGN